MRLQLIAFMAWAFASCTNQPQTQSAASDSSDSLQKKGVPEWIIQGNIYEVNTRQYTPEGTFRAFGEHLQRLKDMGVQTIWFMPIHPISKVERKGPLGSYYAVADYRGINPEHGTMQDWKDLVNRAHSLGLKVIIDWVPNHTGADHPWLQKHPEFYVIDSTTGKPLSPYDWTDVKKLDFSKPAVTDSMIAAMKFWVTETGIDGFRCDHANGPGRAFWEKCIPVLKSTKKDILMLAEAEDHWLYDVGFDMSYAWKFFHKSKDVAAGRRPANSLDSVLHEFDSIFPPHAALLYFTSNHDENSWNLADWKTMPGASHAPFSVITHTMHRSVPLIYSGQEEPFLDSLRFFYKDTIPFNRFERANFYRTLLDLRKHNSALATYAAFKKLKTNKDRQIYAFERAHGGNKVLVVTNLSPTKQEFRFTDKPSASQWKNIFSGAQEEVSETFAIEPWGYAVYEIRK